MQGRASAPAAGTVLNALATGVGSAFAIDADTTATVELQADTDGTPTDASHSHDQGDDAQSNAATQPPEGGIRGEVAGAPEADTALVERCVELAVETWHDSAGVDPETVTGSVRTESEVPMAAGLKSSSAAANATVLATASALDANPAPLTACRLGVQAARETGVTVTGAFDDASASMLGGLTITDNTTDEIIDQDVVDWNVLVWTPPERAFSADADVDRCTRVAPMADLVADLATDGDYGRAMSVNGLAFCAALDFPTDPIVDALPDATGVSLSGTGPSYVAVADPDDPDVSLAAVADRWQARDGETWRTTTREAGAHIL